MLVALLLVWAVFVAATNAGLDEGRNESNQSGEKSKKNCGDEKNEGRR
jgi:hypothetical protein